MKLGLKIILPILLLLLLLLLGSFGYLFYSLKQQETVISEQATKIQKLNSLNERLNRQQYITVYNVLSYRFNQDKALLLEISQAELDKSKTLDEMAPFITSSKGRELVTNYIDTRKEVGTLRNELIKAIDAGDKDQINLTFNKWSIQTQNVKAALSDIGAYNINSLEKTLALVGAIRDKIAQIIITLILVIIATVIFLYFYLRIVITQPIIKLAQFADEIAHKNFTTTTTTTGINSKDEIGMLARSFNTMSTKLKQYYGELEQKVNAKTEELSQKVLALENAKRATMNLLEDLEEAKNNAETLAKNLEKFKLAVDNTSDLVVITDPEGIVLYGNKAIEKITGYKLEEAIGKKSGALWKTPMSSKYYQNLWDIIKTQKKTFIGEIQNKRKNGEVYTTAISISPVLDKSGNIIYFVAIERDITREKEIDKAKTEFVSLASHQLRTPLSTVNWYAEMLLAGDVGRVTPEQRKYLDEIYRSNQRMVELVNALLNVSRLELGTFVVESKPTDVVKLAQSVIDEQKPQIDERKIKFLPLFKKNIPLIQADPKLLRMVIQNLLSNAVKYTPEGGKIKLSLSIVKGPADAKALAGRQLSIVVEDTGYGIPKNQQDKIFTKLFRADNVREKDTEGTGLGLYIVKSIIEQSGGKIWFESEVNKGSTFYVAIPMDGMKKKEGTKELS